MIDNSAPEYVDDPAARTRPDYGYSLAGPAADPAVTIITTLLGDEALLEASARSILRQSFQNWEWLIVTDADRAADARDALGCANPPDHRVHVMALDGVGAGRASNAGFLAARAPNVVELRNGYALEPTAIEKWMWFFESYPNLSFADGYQIRPTAEPTLWAHGLRDGPAVLGTALTLGSRAVRRDVHRAMGGYDESLTDALTEADFFLRCARSGYWGSTVPEFLDWALRPVTHSPRWTVRGSGGVCSCADHVWLQDQQVSATAGGFRFPETNPIRLDDPRSDRAPFENQLTKRTPRLLMIVPYLTVGGSDKFTLDLVQQLDSKGWQISIATTLPGDNTWLPRFARFTPDIFALDAFLHPIDYPRFLRYLISSRQIDCVLVSNSELGYRVLPYLRAHHPQVAFADYCHVETEYWRDGGYSRMSVEYQQLLDMTITSSNHVKQWMVHRGAQPDRIEVAYTNVDTQEWSPSPTERESVRRELALAEETPAVLFVGRVSADKQPVVLARTALELSKRGLDFQMFVAGDGPDLAWLASYVDEHSLGHRVRLLGAVSNQAVLRLMRAADLFFLPSRWEGIALTLFEALACGLVPVAADVGAQHELVTPECGVLVAGGDEDDKVSAYTRTLADLIGDATRRRAMGQAGRARVEALFQLSQMGERMECLLRRAIELHDCLPRPAQDMAFGRAMAQQAADAVQLLQWVDQLKGWSDNQHDQWRNTSDEQERVIGELRAWVGELQRALAWCEDQRSAWEMVARQSEARVVTHSPPPAGLLARLNASINQHLTRK